MTSYKVKIANRVAEICAMFETTQRYCEKYLCDEEPDFLVSITPENIAFERKKSAREDMLEGNPVRDYSDQYLETIAVQRKITENLFDYDTLLFHGSVVAVDGMGYLFTAKSGTGKSTHTRLWREVFGNRAVMVNDDKPFLRLTDEGVLVYGSPWNGKHGLGTNTCVPLKAICILERGERNQIAQISAKDALLMLLQQSNRPMRPQMMPKYMELIDRLAENTAFYRLACNMTPEAAITAYEAMSGKRKED